MADSDDELFQFANSRPLSMPTDDGDEDERYHESLISDAEDEEDKNEKVSWRKRQEDRAPYAGLAEELISGRAAKRLRKDEGSDDDDLFVIEDTKPIPKKQKADASPSSTFSSPLSSCGSPPHNFNTTLVSLSAEDSETRRIMEDIDYTLTSLKRSSHHDSGLNDTDPFCVGEGSSSAMFNLRVRCRGKLYTFEVCMDDPMSVICSKLSAQLKVKDVLLQFNSKDIKTSDTVGDLGLSTVDILNAFVIDKSADEIGVFEATDNEDTINVKLQTSKKCITYSIKTNEPLKNVMERFSNALNVKAQQLKFTFDGEIIKGTMSAQEIGIEDDDIIDAVLT